MSNRWFRVPETGTGAAEDPSRPDHVGAMGLDYAGNKTHPDGAPVWIARVYGTDAELDELAAKAGVTEFSSVPVQALNQMFGQERDAAGWERGFRVG